MLFSHSNCLQKLKKNWLDSSGPFFGARLLGFADCLIIGVCSCLRNKNKRATLLVGKPPEATAKTTRRTSLILMGFQKFTFIICFNICWWLAGGCSESRRSSKGNRRPFGGGCRMECSTLFWHLLVEQKTSRSTSGQFKHVLDKSHGQNTTC